MAADFEFEKPLLVVSKRRPGNGGAGVFCSATGGELTAPRGVAGAVDCAGEPACAADDGGATAAADPAGGMGSSNGRRGATGAAGRDGSEVWKTLLLMDVSRFLVFHHCIDIWASISSIFFSVCARSSGLDGTLLWKKEGLGAVDCVPVISRRRSLRSMSNSRLRTKSLRFLRSISSLSIWRLLPLSPSESGWSRSDQFVAGLRTNLTTFDSKPP